MANNQNLNKFQNSVSEKVGHLDQPADLNAGKRFGIRHVQAAVLGLATFMGYSHRISMSVAIVAMVRNNNTAPGEELAPTFDWDGGKQGYVLSAFFWGYLVLQIPAGIITAKYGGHRFLCFAVIGSSLLTVLTPQSAYLGDWMLVFANRVMQGLCQGFIFPSTYTLLGQWCPTTETSRMATIALAAPFLGMVVTTSISGYLTKAYGWPLVFYTFGIVGIIIGTVMIFLGADSPAKHKRITVEERRYIESSLGGAKVQQSVPWKSVLTSLPYLSALLTMGGYTLGYFLLLTKIPTYLSTVLKFDIEDSGVLTALPYLVALFSSLIFSGLCDFAIDREFLSLTAARKLFESIAHFGSAVCIILMAHMDNRTLSVTLLCILMGFQASSIVGVQANFVDLAPNFSGSIYSVGNFISAVLGLLGPLLVGFIVTEEGSVEQWRIVFYLCASVLVVTNILYIIMGSAETQWWNWPEKYTRKGDLKESDFKSAAIRRRSMPRLSLA